jgi:hypothetical protein
VEDADVLCVVAHLRALREVPKIERTCGECGEDCLRDGDEHVAHVRQRRLRRAEQLRTVGGGGDEVVHADLLAEDGVVLKDVIKRLLQSTISERNDAGRSSPLLMPRLFLMNSSFVIFFFTRQAMASACAP